MKLKKLFSSAQKYDTLVSTTVNIFLYSVPGYCGSTYQWTLNSDRTGLEDDCITVITNKGCAVFKDLTKRVTDGVVHPCQLSDKWCWSSPDPTVLERRYFDNPEISTLMEATLVEDSTGLTCLTVLVFNDNCNISLVPTTDKQVAIHQRDLSKFLVTTLIDSIDPNIIDEVIPLYVNRKLRQFRELNLK